MDMTRYTTQLTQFRNTLYQNFANRADSLMDLLDAMCSDPAAKSVVEYSLAACFLRSYSTIFKAINELNWGHCGCRSCLGPICRSQCSGPFGC